MATRGRSHPGEPHGRGTAGRLNWLRAGVLGANDGIVSVAALVVGVAVATETMAPVVTAGVAAIVGGAISMALGEYVSVSSQSDSEKTLIGKERRELAEMPDQELEELAGLYRQKGISEETARKVAQELTENDVLAAHLSAELNIDQADLVSPWRAALSSALAFTVGAVIPLTAMLLFPGARIPATFIVVVLALALTGYLGAILGGSPVARPMIRVVVGGLLALGATFVIGTLLGSTGIA